MSPELASQNIISNLEAAKYELKTINRNYPNYIEKQVREPI